MKTQGSVFGTLNMKNFNLVVILGVCHSFYCEGLKQSAFEQWANPILPQQPLNVFKSQLK